MSKTTTETTETVTRKSHEYHCDFCGASLRERWREIAQVEISRKVGTSYPEGGEAETETFDCCVSCWDSKVKPTLTGLGATHRTEESDW